METPISVEEAILRVLNSTIPLKKVLVPINFDADLNGRTLAQDVIATENFPSFEASIMDGYAVVGPLPPGKYPVREHIHAGMEPGAEALEKGEVAYITTGAMLPNGANAIVKIEDSEVVQSDAKGTSTMVDIKVNTTAGTWVRHIGSDIMIGQTVLKHGQVLGSAEIGLLATIGLSEVLCYDKPVIGVLSTGSELVDPWVTPSGSQIRDSNRIALITAFREEGNNVIDLGIVSDVKDEVRQRLVDAMAKCDIVVSSGGVSMGAADFVKPLLKEIGTIHFSKLNMKPGKPTTFATIQHAAPATRSSTLFFGLPGNPVSCLVTKSLFVDPAIKRLQGLNSAECLHAQVQVEYRGESPVVLDPERPEYHRATVTTDCVKGVHEARSTGMQRSSRLLSMVSANALLFLPQGPGQIVDGQRVTALLTKALPACRYTQSVHSSAAGLDFADSSSPSPLPAISHSAATGDDYQSFSSMINIPTAPVTASSSSGSSSSSGDASGDSGDPDWRTIRTGLLTISDRAFSGVYPDESGPCMARLLGDMSALPDWPIRIVITHTAVVKDDPDMIKAIIEQWSDNSSSDSNHVDLILTSGGTGFGRRDVTPETVLPLLHRQSPGVAQALLSEGLKHTPLAVLSRPVSGTRNATFICTLPGSVKAVKENIVALKPLIPRIMELIKNGECSKNKLTPEELKNKY
jgi:gephyrin